LSWQSSAIPDQVPKSEVLSKSFVEALNYAATLHLDQGRKGSKVPYLGHLLGVCSLVLEEDGTEDQAIAALLHDAGEDRGGEPTLHEIRTKFGTEVEEIVRACSDKLGGEEDDCEQENGLTE